MALNQTAVIAGAAAGALGAILPSLVLGPGWIEVGVFAGVILVLYLIARFTAGNTVGEVLRGLLIGFNAGLNFAFARIVYAAIGGSAAGLAIAIALGLVNLLCAFHAISGSDLFQGFLGYLNLAMPMSWPVSATGFLLFLVNLIGGIIGAAGAPYFRIEEVSADWSTGTFFTKGGFVANLNPIDTAFNMGNFAFIDRNRASALDKEHEAGHTLNLAAFGWVFHLIGAFDEMVAGSGANAFSERLAESNVPGHGSSGNVIGMWAT